VTTDAAHSSSEPTAPPEASASITTHIEQNIERVIAIHRREWEQTSASQRRVERVSRFVGRPAYLIGVLAFVALWIGCNLEAPMLGSRALDPPPFPMLQGLLTLVALITTTIVLVAQNRQSKLEQQHVHLDLQVNLLTEQKVTKLIHLMEELRRDMPMVPDRHDFEAAAMQQPADTAQVLSAMQEGGLTANDQTGAPESAHHRR